MGGTAPGFPPEGFLLSLLTESYAVRAFFGSLLAVALAATAIRGQRVQGLRARRLIVLAPVLAAIAAGVASFAEAETYLPQLWITSTGLASGEVMEFLGELRVISTERGLDVLFLAWALVAGIALTRRLLGVLATRRVIRRATAVPSGDPLQVLVSRLAARMGAGHVRLLLLDECPGGAFTAGVRRPVVVVDPQLVQALDDQELEGLLAHELAHVARRDTLLALAVGIFSDLTFFLPTVHLAQRWLRREREESADELASVHTRRPAALASSILKVWEGSAGGRSPASACAAVPTSMALQPLGLSEGTRIIAARVERLVSPRPRLSARRELIEVGVAALLVLAASAATLIVPQWIVNELDAYSLAIGYVPPPAQPIESAAFSTFRALAPAAEATAGLHGYERSLADASAPRERVTPCPCVETQAQWLAGEPATSATAPGQMAWRRNDGPTWDTTSVAGSVHARPLLTLPEARLQVGFFVVGREE